MIGGVLGLDGASVGSVYFAGIVSSCLAVAALELELCGDVLAVDEAVVPLEEGGHVLADDAHGST